MSFLNNRWAPLAAFLILAVAVAYLFVMQQSVNEEAIYKAQRASCGRLNSVIDESNSRVAEQRLTTDVLQQFLRDARDARRAEGDNKVAAKYQRNIDDLDGVHFSRLDNIDCNAVIPRP